MGAYVCGIDIGTSGVKIVILRKDGFVAARSMASIPLPIVNGRERFQDATIWWKAVCQALKSVVDILKHAGGSPDQICSICIDATSGTIVPVDESLNPVSVGIMYNDARATEETSFLNEISKDCTDKLGYKFNASFALPKILFLKNQCPDIWAKTRYVLHQADYIVTNLMGKYGTVVTDASNALKTGYDIVDYRWPEYIGTIGILEKLPDVVRTGEVIGVIDREVAKEFGFSTNLKIIAGMTDSVAACVASGARKEGDMNTTLGSTMTWKVLSGNIINDTQGRVYSHLHPGGCYLPGGAGNAGGHGIKNMMDANPQELTDYAATLNVDNPSKYFSYPLPSKGERFPFIDSEFVPFTTSQDTRGSELYQSLIEGAAFIERWGYETMSSLGAKTRGGVWSTGGGAMVDAWMKIRANVLNTVIIRAKYPESAYGSALIAAMKIWFQGDFIKTSDSFVIEEARFEPQRDLSQKYEEYYHSFKQYVVNRRNG